MARLNSVSGFFNYNVAKGLRSKSQSSLMRERAVLNSCIQIEEIQINRSTSIPHRIDFRLNQANLEYLEEIKSNKRKLRLSSAKIANLRCYVLHNAFREQQLITKAKYKGLFLWRSPLTFSTCYGSPNQQSTILLRSAIDLQGKISQQVQRDLYQNPQMLTRISQVHYWLIAELLAQLPLKSYRSSWLFLACSFIIATLVSLMSWYLFSCHKLLALIIAFCVFWLLNTYLKKTLTKFIKSWLIYHLAEGILAKSVVKRQIGLKFLSWLL